MLGGTDSIGGGERDGELNPKGYFSISYHRDRA